MKKILSFLKPIVRGVVKSIPGGNVVTEIADNIKSKKDDNANTHNWWSISMQVLCVAAIVYAFVSKTITIEDLIRLLKGV